ncbi:hypothetical protein J6590_018292 [Homalodisca vitripennis]|nr:hypothetical protein J6590_018292 [Homalodisca vitripennis]
MELLDCLNNARLWTESFGDDGNSDKVKEPSLRKLRNLLSEERTFSQNDKEPSLRRIRNLLSEVKEPPLRSTLEVSSSTILAPESGRRERNSVEKTPPPADVIAVSSATSDVTGYAEPPPRWLVLTAFLCFEI